MTESDVLARAAQALREAHTGEREGSGFTRARIMNTLHRERRRRTLRWAIFSPLASVLLVGSAWAQSSGKWPVIWQAVTSVFVAAPAPTLGPTSQRSAPREKASPARDALPPGPIGALDAGRDDAQSEPAAGPDDAEAGAARAEAPPRRLEPERQRRARERRPAPRSLEPEPRAPAPEPPPEPEPDRELGRFRAAHDLHFNGQARDAIEAYARYLREFPDGRFVPEARYAIALDHIKLGNEAAAREALETFAEGRYGTYRQREARKLLDALAKKKAGSR